MRRRYVSDEELNQVIKLKKAGASWLKIQHKTGVARRSAKRAYEDWQRDQSIDELKAARTNVATEEFRKHLDSLTKVAKSLTLCLDVPSSFNTRTNAKQFLDSLWERDILGEPEPYQRFQDDRKRERQRLVRQNRMLFKSLQNHTRDKVRWDLLDEWKQSWDHCIGLLGELSKEALSVVANFLNQEKDLLTRIKKGSGIQDAVEQIADAVLKTIWQRIVYDRLDPERPVVQTISDGDTTLITLVEFSDNVVFKFTDKSLTQKATRLCDSAARNLCRGDKAQIVESLKIEVGTMKKAIGQLDEMLNPLILRPMILRTRCELCPA